MRAFAGSAGAGERRTVAEGPGRERLEEALREVFGARLRVETAEREGTPAPAAGAESKGGEGAGSAARTGDRNGDRGTDRQGERLSAAETEAVRQSPVTKLVEQELGGTIVGMQRED